MSGLSLSITSRYRGGNSVAFLLIQNFWEFDVPGMTDFLLGHHQRLDIQQLRALSAKGLATKHNHLPADYTDYVFDELNRSLSYGALPDSRYEIDFTSLP